MHRECTADNGGSAAVATPLLPRLCCSCGGCSGREHRDEPLSGGGRVRRVRGGSEHKRANTATTQLSRTGHSLSAAPPRKSSSPLLEEPACRNSIVLTERLVVLRFSMLSSGTMEEFVTEEEEPWYDQQDLEQGKAPSSYPPASPPASCCVMWSYLKKVIRHLKRSFPPNAVEPMVKIDSSNGRPQKTTVFNDNALKPASRACCAWSHTQTLGDKQGN